MMAFYKRELRSYFNGLLGWLVIAVLLLASGIYSAVTNLVGGTTDFSYIVRSMAEPVAVIVPLLAALTFTTENRHGNSLWLASLPTSALQMRLGKYLAALTLLTIPTVFLMIYPPLLENYGPLSYGAAYTALLGYWLMNAALLAVCSVIACCIKRVWVTLLVGELLSLFLLTLFSLVVTVFVYLPIVAFLLCVCMVAESVTVRCIKTKKKSPLIVGGGIAVALTVLYILCPTFYSVFLAKALSAVSLFERLDGFCAGRLDLPATVLYLSVCALSLFVLSVLPAKRYWKGDDRA